MLIKAALSATSAGQGCGIIWPLMLLMLFFTHSWLPQHCRLAHRKDCLDKKLYPLLMHKHRVPTQKCSVCYVFIGRSVKASAQVKVARLLHILKCFFFSFIFRRPPRWLTTNDKLAPSNPCLFCDKCFQMLHYDADGNKLGEFLAYPYVDCGAFN